MRIFAQGRIYQGIHFRFADMDGRTVGKHAANWTFENALRPIQGDEDEDHDDRE